MRSALAALSLTALVALAGCATTTGEATPTPTATAATGDGLACGLWAEAEIAMFQAVSAVQAKGASGDVATAFNARRNELLAAYAEAKKDAESADLKALLDTGLNTDAKMYYDLGAATDAQIQTALQTVEQIVATCKIKGVDVSTVFGSGN
jgi:hypothetical protein